MKPAEAQKIIVPGDEVELTWVNPEGIRLREMVTARHPVIPGMGGYELHVEGDSAVRYLGDGSSRQRPEVRSVLGKVSS